MGLPEFGAEENVSIQIITPHYDLCNAHLSLSRFTFRFLCTNGSHVLARDITGHISAIGMPGYAWPHFPVMMWCLLVFGKTNATVDMT